MINIKDLNFAYDKETNVLSNINLNIPKGKVTAIIGHNGSGKSTLAKLLVGLLEQTKGEIKIDGKVLNNKTLKELRKKIGIIFQNPDNQFVGANVLYDIAFGLENEQVPRDEMLEKINHYAKIMGVDKILEKSPEELSGGQKQKVALAGLLALNKEILIFDEATSMLDTLDKKEITKQILSLKDDNKTVIIITHDIMIALKSDYIILLKEGKVIGDGTPKEFISKKDLLKSSKIELPTPIKLMYDLEKDGIKDILWEYVMKM